MVSIPEDAKKMIREQQVIILGSADKTGLSNISPRTSFYMTDDEIYWFEFFKHKSYHNFINNPWVCVAIFDSKKFSGYQLKGKVSIVKEKSETYYLQTRIIDRLTRLNKKITLEMVSKYQYNIIKFSPKIVYSLNPIKFADVPVILDADVEVGRLLGGVNIESSFGISKKSVETLVK